VKTIGTRVWDHFYGIYLLLLTQNPLTHYCSSVCILHALHSTPNGHIFLCMQNGGCRVDFLDSSHNSKYKRGVPKLLTLTMSGLSSWSSYHSTRSVFALGEHKWNQVRNASTCVHHGNWLVKRKKWEPRKNAYKLVPKLSSAYVNSWDSCTEQDFRVKPP